MKPSNSGLTKQELIKMFPEAPAVLATFGHGVNAPPKPLKFYQKITIIPCPSSFCPSAQGDFAFTKSFHVDARGRITGGPGFGYDTMICQGINPYERTVNVPKGERVWVATYDGQWGGYWSRVLVFVGEVPALAAARSAQRV